ncbi:MAG: hypothetical protein M3Z46_07890, partial [Actinomycetota bacterium]|nr:hypothetical protein [Actinomycetota bacterium]
MTAIAAVATVGLPATTAGATRAVASAPATRVGFSGHAFATYVTAAGVVRSGPSAVSALGCGPPAGTTTSNSTVAVDVPGVLHGATLATTGSTYSSGTADRVATTATAQSVTFPGALTATAVKAESNTVHDSGGYRTSGTGTSIASLKLAGVPLPVLANPAPNTTIGVPGVGTLILNEQHTTITATSATITVIAMHLSVTIPGPQAGANFIVGYAYSALTAPTTGFVSGQAYGTQAQLGSLVGSGPSFLVNLPCGGTNGNLLTNTGAGVTVPTFLTAGAVTNTGRGSSNPTTASGQT